MKKIYLLTFTCFFCSYLKAQTGVLFKIKYLPEHSYESIISSDMNMEMNADGDKNEIDAMKEKGIKLPIIGMSSTEMNVNILTGSVNRESSFPITMDYASIVSKKAINGEQVTAPPNSMVGQKIYGECTTSGQIRLDSISGKAVDETVKKILAGTLSNIINIAQFPDKPLNIGDKFSQDIPYNLPIAGTNIQLIIKRTYKLTAIEQKEAFFDVDQSMIFDISKTKDGITMSGKGTGKGEGKMIYVINENYPAQIKTKFTIDYQMQIKSMHLSGKILATNINQTKITDLTKQK